MPWATHRETNDRFRRSAANCGFGRGSRRDRQILCRAIVAPTRMRTSPRLNTLCNGQALGMANTSPKKLTLALVTALELTKPDPVVARPARASADELAGMTPPLAA